jgi:hypothetical protein
MIGFCSCRLFFHNCNKFENLLFLALFFLVDLLFGLCNQLRISLASLSRIAQYYSLLFVPSYITTLRIGIDVLAHWNC